MPYIPPQALSQGPAAQGAPNAAPPPPTDAAAASGPGVGGASTTAGIQAAMQQQQQQDGGQPPPPPPQDPNAQPATDPAQVQAPPPQPQPPQPPPPQPGFQPNSQGQQLYPAGQGPVTEQVPQLDLGTPTSQQQDADQSQMSNDMMSAPIQQGQEQQASYDSWQRIKAAATLARLRKQAAAKAKTARRGGEKAPNTGKGRTEAGNGGGERSEGRSEGRSDGRARGPQKQFAPSPVAPALGPTLPPFHAMAVKQALISMQGKQPIRSAVGESGMVDEIAMKPWSEYGEKAWPDKNSYWSTPKLKGRGTTHSKMAGLGTMLGEWLSHISPRAKMTMLGAGGGALAGGLKGALVPTQGKTRTRSALEDAAMGATLGGTAGSLGSEFIPSMGRANRMWNLQQTHQDVQDLVRDYMQRQAMGGPIGSATPAAGKLALASDNKFWCKKCNCPCFKCDCKAGEKQADMSMADWGASCHDALQGTLLGPAVMGWDAAQAADARNTAVQAQQQAQAEPQATSLAANAPVQQQAPPKWMPDMPQATPSAAQPAASTQWKPNLTDWVAPGGQQAELPANGPVQKPTAAPSAVEPQQSAPSDDPLDSDPTFAGYRQNLQGLAQGSPESDQMQTRMWGRMAQIDNRTADAARGQLKPQLIYNRQEQSMEEVPGTGSPEMMGQQHASIAGAQAAGYGHQNRPQPQRAGGQGSFGRRGYTAPSGAHYAMGELSPQQQVQHDREQLQRGDYTSGLDPSDPGGYQGGARMVQHNRAALEAGNQARVAGFHANQARQATNRLMQQPQGVARRAMPVRGAMPVRSAVPHGFGHAHSRGGGFTPQASASPEPLLCKLGGSATALSPRLISKLVPLTGKRRDEFSPEEAQEIGEGEKQWIPPILQTDATPITSLLSSPGKQGLLGSGLGALLGGAAGAGIGGLLGHVGIGAGIGAGVGGLAGYGPAYEHRWRKNEHLKEMMRRLEPGATKRDYSGQQMLLSALEDRFGGEEKMSSVKEAGMGSSIYELLFKLLGGGERAVPSMVGAGPLGEATAREFSRKVPHVPGLALEGTGMMPGPAPRGPHPLRFVGEAAPEAAGGATTSAAAKPMRVYHLDPKLVGRRIVKSALDLSHIDTDDVKNHIVNWWSGLSDTQKAMVAAGGAGAGLGLFSVAPSGLKRGLVGGALGAGAGYAYMQPGVHEKLDTLLHGPKQVEASVKQATPMGFDPHVAGGPLHHGAVAAPTDMAHLGGSNFQKEGPLWGTYSMGGASGAFRENEEMLQQGAHQSQPGSVAPSLSELNAQAPKLAAFAAGFIQECAAKGMEAEEVVELAKQASALDPIIAEDLEPLTKEALPMGWLTKLLKPVGQGLLRVGEKAVGPEAAANIGKIMGRGSQETALHVLPEAAGVAAKVRPAQSLLSRLGQSGWESAKGIMRPLGQRAPEDVAKSTLGRMGQGALQGGMTGWATAGMPGDPVSEEADPLGLYHALAGAGIGAVAHGNANIARSGLLRRIENMGMRSAAGGLMGNAVDQGLGLADINTVTDENGMSHPGSTFGTAGKLIGLGSGVPGIRRGATQLGEETLGNLGRKMQEPLASLRNKAVSPSARSVALGGGDAAKAVETVKNPGLLPRGLNYAGQKIEAAPQALQGAENWALRGESGFGHGFKDMAFGPAGAAMGVGTVASIGNAYKQGFQKLHNVVHDHLSSAVSSMGGSPMDANGQPRSVEDMLGEMGNNMQHLSQIRGQITEMAPKLGVSDPAMFGPDGQLNMEGVGAVVTSGLNRLQGSMGGNMFSNIMGQVGQWFVNLPPMSRNIMLASIVPILLGVFTGHAGAGVLGGAAMAAGGALMPQMTAASGNPQAYRPPSGMVFQ